jgi:hypothetical protein
MILPNPHHAAVPVTVFNPAIAMILQSQQPGVVKMLINLTVMFPKRELPWKNDRFKTTLFF